MQVTFQALQWFVDNTVKRDQKEATSIRKKLTECEEALERLQKQLADLSEHTNASDRLQIKREISRLERTHATLKSSHVACYSRINDNIDHINIYIFGINADAKRVMVQITDFEPTVYLELPSGITLTQFKIDQIKQYITKECEKWKLEILEFKCQRKTKIYYNKPATVFKVKLINNSAVNKLKNIIKLPINLPGVSNCVLRMHEQSVSELLHIVAERKVSPSGWITVSGTEPDTPFANVDIQLCASMRGINPAPFAFVVSPRVLSFDIECVSADVSGNTFPNPSNDSDPIICISATVTEPGTSPKTWCLVNEQQGKVCPQVSDGSTVLHFPSERNLLLGWRNFVCEQDPDVLTGYNTLSFDDRYISTRAQKLGCWPEFCKLSRLCDYECPLEARKWASSAYGDQQFDYIDIPGRVHLDMYPIIFKEFTTLMSYKLDYISEYFLNDHKNDLPAHEMIQKWHKGDPQDIKIIVEYCNKDTILPIKLMEKLNTWIGLVEFSNVVNVQLFDLITRGQQIRVFSQIYPICFAQRYLCTEKFGPDYNPPPEERTVVGATVQNPIQGLHENVATFDFQSLYPTTIIAYNICFSTFIPWDPPPVPLPDPADYHDIQWDEHVGCPHDTAVRKTKVKKIVCTSHHYRFWKSHIVKGIVPQLLEKLLAARAKAKEELKAIKDAIKAKTVADPAAAQLLAVVLDKRQNSFKVSANSVPGDTPIPCKTIAGEFMYIPICAAGLDWVDDSAGNQIARTLVVSQVWSAAATAEGSTAEGSFSPILYLIRHKSRAPFLYRIVTTSGIVDCTAEHSLVLANGRPVKPLDLHIGDVLLTSEPQIADQKDWSSDSLELKNLGSDIWTANKLVAAEAVFAFQNFCTIAIIGDQYYIKQSAVQLPGQIQAIYKIPWSIDEWVYDIETESHHFAAGIGNLIVHNSCYGGFGSEYSNIPFYPAAATTTAMGRRNIQRAIDFAKTTRPDTLLVYGDTDSCMLKFKNVTSLQECFEVAESLEHSINTIFPKPMYLEMEKVYSKYLLLSKKRYLGYIVDKTGKIISTDKKGIVLKRRDNCEYLRIVYSKLIEQIMSFEPKWKIYESLAMAVDNLLQGNVPLKELILVKSIKEHYKSKNLPHLRVAEKMKTRGRYVTAGTRISYVFIKTHNKNDPQYVKSEDPEYVTEAGLAIDYLYYLKSQLITPIDELLAIKFGRKKVMENLFKLLNKNVIDSARVYFMPVFNVGVMGHDAPAAL